MAFVFPAQKMLLVALAPLAFVVPPVAWAQTANSFDNLTQDGPDYTPDKPLRATNLVCSPTGYAAPTYNMFGQNGGSGQAPFEIASPCLPDEVVLAAEAVGMGRSRPIGVKNVVTIMFSAEGTLAGKPVKNIDFQVSYALPAMRMEIDYAGPKPAKVIEVFSDDKAWNESTEGEGLTPMPKTLADRFPLTKLTPYGALWSPIEAEGHAKVGKVAGKTVLTGASPYDGIAVTTTLDERRMPVSVSFKSGGHTYGATFAGYSDKWESKYLVIFPEFITWTKDGKPYADLKVTAFKSNPYVLFPPPVVKTASN